ncbi:cleavage and polyadenylation specificity factor subunit 6-like [Oenanthe melanoleuca]|uniref:cleavage and polyadenylation specificity factor subunit 6-like n=1 Tax=Oenanthe melanoleuca TaxID=2939378 RepID=UPI0024C10531|nr:cleavage and polyadenylation specificity factor subunit 6-like [Oenanthe melanoleuca]
MDVVLSAGREQVITLTCIRKGVCGERVARRSRPCPRAIGGRACPSRNCATGRGRGGARALPRPQRTKGLTEGLEVLDSGHTIRFPSLGGGGGGGDGGGCGGGSGSGRRMLSRRRLEALSGGRDCRRRLIYQPYVTSSRSANEGVDWPARGGVRTHRANAAAPRLARGEWCACAEGGPGSARGGACAVRGSAGPGPPGPSGPPVPPLGLLWRTRDPQNPPGKPKIPLGHPPSSPRPTKYPHEPQNTPRDPSNTSVCPWDSSPNNTIFLLSQRRSRL